MTTSRTIARHQFLVGAPRRSSGKTTLSVGLCAEIARRGVAVFPYKKGPDYIDPMWLSRAADNTCLNLDFKTQTRDELLAAGRRVGADSVMVVEANMALHDGSPDGDDSSAALAILLDLPVVLVIDCRGLTRSVAAEALGYTQFAPNMPCAGVVLNRVVGARHERALRRAIADHTPLRVFGAIAEDERVRVIERALGLVPTAEHGAADDAIARIREHVAQHVDVDALLDATRVEVGVDAPPRESLAASSSSTSPLREPSTASSSPTSLSREPSTASSSPTSTLRVGVFRDEAFCFYYPDDLQRFEANAAELVFIDALRDTRLPKLDALFIGGGFPETQAARLEANADLRAAVKAALEQGLPTYAECGGMVYLARALEWRGRRHEMVGVLAADAIVSERPRGKGYMRIRETADMPWPQRPDGEYFAHEFHYSELRNWTTTPRHAYTVLNGTGLGDGRDGIVQANLLASYAHRRASVNNDWPARFCAFARAHRRASSNAADAADAAASATPNR